jgi:hypothetical protein
MRIATILVVLSLSRLILPGAARAPEVRFRAPLAVSVRWIAVEYGNQQIHGQAIVLRGEPLEIELGIFNPHLGASAGAELDWPARVSLSLRRGDRFDQTAPLVAALRCEGAPDLLRTHEAYESGDHVLLRDSGAQFYRCRIAAAERYYLQSGAYTLSAQWIDGAISSGTFRQDYDSRQRAVVQFELRDIQSPADNLDLDIHLAQRALNDDKDPTEAIRLADRVLEREPSSAAALIIRGHASAAMLRCQEARTAWEHAANVLEGALDKTNRRSSRWSSDERRRLADQWRDKARQPCP